MQSASRMYLEGHGSEKYVRNYEITETQGCRGVEGEATKACDSTYVEQVRAAVLLQESTSVMVGGPEM